MYNTGARVLEMNGLQIQRCGLVQRRISSCMAKDEKSERYPCGHIRREYSKRGSTSCLKRGVSLHSQMRAGIRWRGMESSICCGRRLRKQHRDVAVSPASGFRHTPYVSEPNR